MSSFYGASKVVIEDAWYFVVGKNSDLTNVYGGSCIIRLALFVCYGSCQFWSVVFLSWIPYPRVWRQVHACTDCLLEEPADCELPSGCLDLVEYWTIDEGLFGQDRN